MAVHELVAHLEQRVLIVRDRHAAILRCSSLESSIEELRDALEDCLALELLVKR